MEWLELALSRPVLLRGLKYAVVVGSVLIAINHGDAILHGEIGADRWAKMALTVVVPFVVSTSSSVAALMERRRQD